MSAITTATIIGVSAAAASAGATVYAAKKGASAAKDAAATQSAAGDKALDLQKQMYTQQQANLAPYRSLGQGSLANLGNFQSFAGTPGAMGAGVQSQYQHALSPGMGGAAPGAVPPTAPEPPPPLSPAERGGIFHRQPSATLANPTPPGGVPQSPNAGMDFGQMGQAVQQAPGGGPMPGALVTVRAPTGQVAHLPREMAMRAVAQGAQIIPEGGP